MVLNDVIKNYNSDNFEHIALYCISNDDEFMDMMVLQYGLDYKLLDLTNRDISSPTRQDSWNRPEQNGIAQNKMESPIPK
jgi:hypothetical protein